ncbi:hypothetical protein D9M72_502190 [compost metagenome]
MRKFNLPLPAKTVPEKQRGRRPDRPAPISVVLVEGTERALRRRSPFGDETARNKPRDELFAHVGRQPRAQEQRHELDEVVSRQDPLRIDGKPRAKSLAGPQTFEQHGLQLIRLAAPHRLTLRVVFQEGRERLAGKDQENR